MPTTENTVPTTGTATLVKKKLDGFTGSARLYRLDPPVALTNWDGGVTGSSKYVVVSATSAYSGPETCIFPADDAGNVTDWGELNGSFRGDFDHERALRNAGYEVTA